MSDYTRFILEELAEINDSITNEISLVIKGYESRDLNFIYNNLNKISSLIENELKNRPQ
jgi:hypothetical protein